MALSVQTKLVYGTIGAVVFFLGFFLVFASMFAPFVLGAIMAYGYRPVKRFFSKKSIAPSYSALLLAIVTYGFFAYCIVTIIPLVVTWSGLLSVKINIYRDALRQFFNPMMDNFFKDTGPQIQEGVDMLLRQGVKWIGSVAMYLLNNTWALGHIFLTLALSPVVAFYLVKDGAKMRRHAYSLIPRPYRGVIGLCLRDMDRALRQYFSGQVRVCVLLVTYYVIFLGFGLHLPNAIILSFVTGLFVFIPYLGFFISFFAACMVGVVESGQWPYVCSIALVYLGGNILESLVLTPYLVGKRAGLHPLGVLLAILIGGSVKGVLGIVLALPVATLTASCWRLMRRTYMNSTLYRTGF